SAETDDVGPAVAVNVRKPARVEVVAAPTTGVDTEGGKLKRGRPKKPASGALQGHVDTVSAKADDVGFLVAVNVRKLARGEVLAAPAAGVDTEGGKRERGRGKAPALKGQRHVDTGSAAAHHVGSAHRLLAAGSARKR